MNFENEKVIKCFLFGELPEEERFEFEERFITNADLFEEIKVVEDELIEKYVRGWMDSAERSKFEQYFLTTNKRRERVEFSRQMIQKVDRQKETVAVAIKKNEVETSEESVWNKLAALFSIPRFVAAGALGLLIAVLGTWVLFQSFGGKETILVRKETPTPTVAPTLEKSPEKPPQNNQSDSVNVNQDGQPNREKNTLNQTVSNKNTNKTPRKPTTPKKPRKEIKKTPSRIKTPPTTKSAPNPILALFAGTVRSGGKNRVLNLPKEAKAATLQLNLESVDYKIFQAQLTDADGNVVFQRNNLKPRKSKVNFNIPTKNLKRGDYIIKLNGKNNSGENESVADFQFRVNR